MKKHVLKLMLLLSPLFINGQDKWCNYIYTLHGPYYEMGEFCGDTIIDNKKYDIVVTSLFDIKDLTFLESRRNGYRRISNDSVFYLVHSDKPGFSEDLYYAYNLKVNDRIVLTFSIRDTFRVTKVDTLNLLEKNRRRLYLKNERKNDEYEDIWIEGIGSIINGYLSPGLSPYLNDAGSSFSCYYDSKSGQTYAPYDSLHCHLDKLVKACAIPSSNKNILSGPQSFISPNPLVNGFDLNTKEENIEMSIFNINGILLKYQSYYGNHKSIDCKELASGFYFIELKIRNKLEVLKFIKN